MTRKISEVDKKRAKEFLLEHDLKLFFMKVSSARYYSHLRSIVLPESPRDDGRDRFWSVIFHEFAHEHCRQNGLYKYYHSKEGFVDYDYKKRYGLRVERFVDKKAKQLMEEYDPSLVFIAGYSTPRAKEIYHKGISHIRDELALSSV